MNRTSPAQGLARPSLFASFGSPNQASDIPMDISRNEQRVLHALAQGGRIAAIKDQRGKIVDFEFFSRDG
jgi:hypothetical protein